MDVHPVPPRLHPTRRSYPQNRRPGEGLRAQRTVAQVSRLWMLGVSSFCDTDANGTEPDLGMAGWGLVAVQVPCQVPTDGEPPG
jgi:hypothetical protein